MDVPLSSQVSLIVDGAPQIIWYAIWNDFPGSKEVAGLSAITTAIKIHVQ